MAVQSHSPSSNLLPDLLRRMHSVEQKNISGNAVVNGKIQAVDLQSSPWLNVFNTPITVCQQQPMKTKGASGIAGKEGVTCKMNKLKRTWDAACEEPVMANRAVAGANGAFLMGTAPVFTGLRLATSCPVSDNSSSQPSTSGFHAPDFTPSLQAHLDKHTSDVSLLIDSQASAMKQAIEEKSALHTQALLSLLEERVAKRLKRKDEELKKVKMRTMELEEGLKQLSLEAQLWKNLAKNNELMALNLKQNLEQVVAQMREHHQHNHGYHHMSREEGCGESEVDDAESCQHVGGEGSFSRELKDLKDQRKCKFCRVNDVCVLLLPCRHLCLCLECGGRLDRCPLCGITKNASLQVYT